MINHLKRFIFSPALALFAAVPLSPAEVATPEAISFGEGRELSILNRNKVPIQLQVPEYQSVTGRNWGKALTKVFTPSKGFREAGVDVKPLPN
jgi:hypothetical protein